MKKKPSRKAKVSKLVKPLTKEQLVKLYEEFKEKRLKEHNEKLDRYYELGYADLRCTIMLENLHFWNWKKRLQGLAKRLDRERPIYDEPTFNEFMESLGEKKDLMDEWVEANAEWERGMAKRMNKQLFGSCQR